MENPPTESSNDLKMFSSGSFLLIVLFACKLSLLIKSAANCLYPLQSPSMTSSLVSYLSGFHPVVLARPVISEDSFLVIQSYVFRCVQCISVSSFQIFFLRDCFSSLHFLTCFCGSRHQHHAS